jgi:hypothetical protein
MQIDTTQSNQPKRHRVGLALAQALLPHTFKYASVSRTQ